MAVSRRILGIGGSLLMILACILYIVSNAVPIWGTVKVGQATNTIGLWQGCISIPGYTQCSALVCLLPGSTPCIKNGAARAFVTLACIFSAVAALCLLASAILTDLSKLLAMMVKIVPFSSLLVGVIGVGVGINLVTYKTVFSIGAAAIVGILALILNLAGTILAFLIQ
ncbi:unnamed protein product [Rotaria socialis]|uniref:Uncharacterized protein n=1 Tax=Rotaria socialis TaxID=392032 RepID=A0A818XST8_9BILA|nr:unnamed protein product [Rotaria socialis]CAF4781827.1 unnamed protein product [Rotaria socialis]